MQIDDGGSSSAEAARRAAEEAARRAAEEAARKAAEEAARAAAAQAAADEAAEQAFQNRLNHPLPPPDVAPEPQAPPSPPAAPPADVMEPAPPMNRLFRDEIAASQAETAALGHRPTAQSYRVDPSGNLVADTPPPTSEQRAGADYDALTPEQQAQIPRPAFVTQRAEEYHAVAQFHGQATLKVDAQITAALDDQGPNSREAAILRSQRDRLIQSQTKTALDDFRDTRDAAALADVYTEQPDRWTAAAAQMGLDPKVPPDAAAIKDYMQFDRKLDEQSRINAQIALNNLPPTASEADRAVALAQAATKTRLDGMAERGALQVPQGADAQAWREDQAQLAGEAARERQLAIAAGQDPDRAVAQSARLYDLQLQTGLENGSIKLEGATTEQVAAWKAQQLSRFQDAVALSNANGLDMADAQSRISRAYEVQDSRIAAQLQINAAVQNYNDTTTALQRGGEAIRGFAYGDGVNHLEFAQQQIGQVEALEKQYQQILLDAKGPLTDAQQKELSVLKQKIDGQIDLTVTNAGLNVAHSQAQAAMYRPVESALFGTVYAGSSFLPGGVVIGATVKLLLDDLPNGRIRSNGNVWETSQDVAISMALGAGNVAVGKLDPTRGGTTTLLRAGANPLLERAAQVGLESAVGAVWAGGSSVGSQMLDANRDPGRAIDWQRAGEEALAGLGGSAIGGWAGRAVHVAPGNVAQAILKDSAVGFSSSAIVDATMQYGTSGQVDAQQAVQAGLAGGFNSALGGFTNALGQQGKLRAATPGAPAPAPADAAPPRPAVAPDAPVAGAPDVPVPAADVPGGPDIPGAPRGVGARPPKGSGITPEMQAAIQEGMQKAGVLRLGIRPPKADSPAWHAVGGDTQFTPLPEGTTVPDIERTVVNPGMDAAPETSSVHWVDGRPVTLDPQTGRPVFPAGPIDGNTGAIFPTKPVAAQDMSLDEARLFDETLRQDGATLDDAAPALDGFYARDANGDIVGQQLGLGSVRPGIQKDGTVAAVVSDLDLAYAIGRDGKPLTPDQVEKVLVPAINQSYRDGYLLSNHGVHADGILNPAINAPQGLDSDKFWNEGILDFHPENGYTGTTPFHETFLQHYAPEGFERASTQTTAWPSGVTATGDPAGGYRLTGPEGKPVSLERAVEAVPSLFTDAQSPHVQKLMGEDAEVFQVAYYKPEDGTLRVQEVRRGVVDEVDVSYDDILSGAREGEIPIAGVHNHEVDAGVLPGTRDFVGNDDATRETQADFGIPFREYVFTTDHGRPVIAEFGRDVAPPRWDAPLSASGPAARGQILDNAQQLAAVLQTPGLSPLKRAQVLGNLESLYTRGGTAVAGLDLGQPLAAAERADLDRQLSTARTVLASELRAVGPVSRRDVHAIEVLRRTAADELSGLLGQPDFSPADILQREGIDHVLGVGPSGSLAASAFAQRAQAQGWSGDLGYMVPMPAQRRGSQAPDDFLLSVTPDRFKPGDTVLVLDDVVITGRTREATERFWHERFPDVNFRFGSVLDRDRSQGFVRALGYEPPAAPASASADLVLARERGGRP